MGRYIQGDDGKMKGSIGSGKSAIPGPRFTPRMLLDDGGKEMPAKRVDQYGYMADTEPEPKFPTPADFLVDVWSFFNNLGKPRR